MKFLLDTHVFLWWMMDIEKIPTKIINYIQNENNNIFLSPASSWEICIKAKLGKLEFHTNPADFIFQKMQEYSIQSLPINHGHTTKTYHLSEIHKDPFDRILIAQSIQEKIPLITNDSKIKNYAVEVIWD